MEKYNLKNKKRLGIIVLFDKNSTIDEYAYYLLDSLKDFLTEMIIVVNGNILLEAENRIRKKYDNLIIRENIGFDGGAYKDVFLNYLNPDFVSQWDEIVLCNDSFYGPFEKWDNIFSYMDDEEADFWGLSRYKRDDLYPEHIQAYFLVCRHSMLHKDDFYAFWKQLAYPQNYHEAVLEFEINFSNYFRKLGYSYKSYADIAIPQICVENGKNLYIEKAYELVASGKFPLLKRKALDMLDLKRNEKIIGAINQYHDYETQLITENFERLCLEKREKSLNYYIIRDFYSTKKRVYIFGNGYFGIKVQNLFAYKGWQFQGIVISDNPTNLNNIILLDNLILEENDGLIVALGMKAFQEVRNDLLSRFKKEQLLLPFEELND